MRIMSSVLVLGSFGAKPGKKQRKGHLFSNPPCMCSRKKSENQKLSFDKLKLKKKRISFPTPRNVLDTFKVLFFLGEVLLRAYALKSRYVNPVLVITVFPMVQIPASIGSSNDLATLSTSLVSPLSPIIRSQLLSISRKDY